VKKVVTKKSPSPKKSVQKTKKKEIKNLTEKKEDSKAENNESSDEKIEPSRTKGSSRFVKLQHLLTKLTKLNFSNKLL